MPRSAQAVVATFQSSRPPEAQHLKTSSVAFAIWWVVLLLLHGVNVGYYGLAGVLYRALRSTTTDFQLTTYAIGISHHEYFKVSTIHWIIAVLHALSIAAMVLGSLQARRLVFVPKLPQWLTKLWSTMTNRATRKPPTEARNSVAGSLSRRVSSFSEFSLEVTHSVLGRDGLLGVDSVYFDHLLLARELLETTLQTIQVYRMSYLLPRVWLIRFYVILLIANCWSMPILHRYYHNRHVQRRMMSLLCDAVLDMVSSIGVSFWIFATYAPQYKDPIYGFPLSNWFNDVWFTNVQQEFQMMLVVSWADMASRLVFAVGVLQCMESIKEMLTPPIRTKTPRALADRATAAAAVKPSKEQDKAAQEPLKLIGPPTGIADGAKTQQPRVLKASQIVKFLLEKAGPAFFVVFGFVILIVHIVSETRQPSSQIPCRLQLRPWFVSKPACSLVELDCHQLGGLSGSQESMKEAWNTYEFDATARLFVRHCPQLDVPATLQNYRQITSLKLYNTTVTSWPAEAAFTSASHKKICAFFAIRTNFSNGELPPGLLSTEFPKVLINFVTSFTNIAKIPDHLHELWPPGMTLSFEMSQLQAVPPPLFKVNPFVLTFSGSPIASVPAEMFEAPLLGIVGLSFTKVQELPRFVAKPSAALYLMWLQGTNITTFWSWMEPFVRLSFAKNKGFFNAFKTPFCRERDAIVAGNQTSFSITTNEPGAHDLASVMDVSTPEKLQYSLAAVVCGKGTNYYFPTVLQDATTAIRK